MHNLGVQWRAKSKHHCFMSFVYNIVLILGKTQCFSSSFDFSFQTNSNTLVTCQIWAAVQQNGKIRSIWPNSSHYSLRVFHRRGAVPCRASLGKETGAQSFPQSKWVLLVYFKRLILPQWQSVNACSTCGLTTEYPTLGTMSTWPLATQIRSELQHPSCISIFLGGAFQNAGYSVVTQRLKWTSLLCLFVFIHFCFMKEWWQVCHRAAMHHPKIPRRRQQHNSEHVTKFQLVIVWCLVPSIYKII